MPVCMRYYSSLISYVYLLESNTTDKVNNLGKDSNVTNDEVNQLKLQLKDIKEQVNLPNLSILLYDLI